MNAEIKQRWLSALRSGDYKQTQTVLHRVGGGYCCLGVLCDLWLKEQGKEWLIVGFKDAKTKSYTLGEAICDGESAVLPISVQVWAGLEDENPSIPINEYPHPDLAALNDSGWSFAQIANVIEVEL